MSLRLIDIKTEIYIEITIEKMKIIIEYGQPTRIMRRKPMRDRIEIIQNDALRTTFKLTKKCKN